MFGANDIIIHTLLFFALYFEVFLLITFFERFGSTKVTLPTPKRLPSVSIIVPCYNEERTIVGTLRSLLRLNYPSQKLRFIIVDDGSTDNTWAVMQRFRKYQHVTLLQKENGGKHTALNTALEHVGTDLVGCLDADSFVHPEALREIVPYFSDTEVMAVTPAIKVNQPKNIIQHIQTAEYNLSIFIRRTFAFLNAIFITPGPFSIFRRSVFDHIGTYREAHNTEDLEIALRMQTAGLRIENAHRALVYTNTPPTIRALIRQRVRWTYGFLKNAFDYRLLFFSRRHGNLGMLILPMTLVAIGTALYFTTLLILSIVGRAASKLLEVEAIGLAGFRATFSFDWFFIHTESMLFLIYALAMFTVALIVIGKKLSLEKRTWSLDMLYYILLYGFLAPIWLAKALGDAILSRQSSWTAEKPSAR